MRTELIKKEIIPLSLLFFVAIGIKLYFLQYTRVISADGTGYAQIARDFIQGNGFENATHFPPFYPALMGLLNLLVPDIELAGRLVSIFMGSLIVIPIYLLAKEFFNKNIGIIACLLAIVWPSIRAWSGEVMSQSTYITLILMGIYLTWRAFKKESVLLSAFAGMFMGLSYLTRPEAFIVLFAMTFVLLVYGLINRMPVKALITFVMPIWITFILISFPYINLLHEKTGTWQMTNKTKTGLYHSLGEYYGKGDLYNVPDLPPIGILDVLTKYPDFLRHKVSGNLREIWHNLLPFFMWPFLFWGFVAGRWGKERVVEKLFLLSTMSPMIMLVSIFFVTPEYTQAYLPILFLWIGQGIMSFEALIEKKAGLKKWFSFQKGGYRFSLAFIATVIFCVTTLTSQVPKNWNKIYHFSHDGGRYDRKLIGLMLKEHLPVEAKIMTRWGRISFYSEREFIMIPNASFREILETAKENKAKYMIVDGALMGMRPQLGPLFQPLRYYGNKFFRVYPPNEGLRPYPGLKLFLLYKDPASVGVAVYEIVE